MNFVNHYLIQTDDDSQIEGNQGPSLQQLHNKSYSHMSVQTLFIHEQICQKFVQLFKGRLLSQKESLFPLCPLQTIKHVLSCISLSITDTTKIYQMQTWPSIIPLPIFRNLLAMLFLLNPDASPKSTKKFLGPQPKIYSIKWQQLEKLLPNSALNSYQGMEDIASIILFLVVEDLQQQISPSFFDRTIEELANFYDPNGVASQQFQIEKADFLLENISNMYKWNSNSFFLSQESYMKKLFAQEKNIEQCLILFQGEFVRDCEKFLSRPSYLIKIPAQTRQIILQESSLFQQISVNANTEEIKMLQSTVNAMDKDFLEHFNEIQKQFTVNGIQKCEIRKKFYLYFKKIYSKLMEVYGKKKGTQIFFELNQTQIHEKVEVQEWKKFGNILSLNK